MSEPVPHSDATMAYQPEAPPSPATMASPGTPLSIPSMTGSTDDAAVSGYEIISELGRGGMGVVYKARQTALNRIVALKMILSGKHTGEAQLARFRAEAEALAKIQHPNIVQVYDVGSHQGHPYIALEYVEGGNLAEKTKSIPQPPRASARLVQLLAQAIQTAHEAGIIHRDLKPVNILLHHFVLGDAGHLSGSSSAHYKSSSKSSSGSRHGGKQSILTHVSVEYGTPKITDFGLAKQEEGAASGMTHAGSIMGTPSYMSPEQAIGDVGLIGPATDVYALGAILYEMLTGRPPFRADTPVNTIMQVIRGEVVAPSKLVAKLPLDLETITLKCLEKGTHRRYPSAAALAEDLENYLEDRPITARAAGRVERFVKWVRRHPMVSSFIGATIFAAIAFVVLGVWAYLAVTDRAHAAEQAQEMASAAAAESKQRLIHLAVANGAQLLDRGDMLGGAVWFAEALKLDENNKQSVVMHRKRIAAVLERCPILAHLWEHEAAVNDLALSHDGQIVATGGNDGLVRLWNLKTGKVAHVPLEHGSAIAAIEFAPDGKELIVLSTDGSCRLWNWQTAEARELGQGVAVAHYSRDGANIVTVGKPGGMVVFRRSDLERLTGMMANNGSVADFAFSPDGQLALAPSRDGFVRLWELSKGTLKVPQMKQGSPATCAAMHSEGKLGASGGDDGQVWLWNLTTGELALPVPWKHDGAVTQVKFSPDGRWLATASEDKQCIVWDVVTGKQYSPRLRHGSKVTHIVFSPDARWIATISEDNFTRIWDIRSGRLVVSPFRSNGTPKAVAFTPDGRGLLITGQSRLLLHWVLPIQLDEDTDLAVFKAASDPLIDGQSRLLTSPDGKLAANYGGDQPVRVRDATTREPLIPPLKTGGATSAVAFTQNSEWLATAGLEGAVQVWSTKTGNARWPSPGGHTCRVYFVAFHPQGTMLATGSADNTIRFWDAETGKPLFAPIRTDGGVYWLSFSADGTTLFSASLDGSSRVWDTSTGEALTPKLPAWTGQPWKDELDTTEMKADELLVLTQVLTGMEVDKQGAMTLLDATSIRQRYTQVQGKSEQTYIPTDDAAWHEYHASAAEKQGQWFALAWQLERLTLLVPKNADYRKRLAEAWSKLGAWPKVVEASTQLLRTSPASIDGWLQRGRAYGELKQWRESLRDITQGARLQQQPEWRAVMPALMKLDLGDMAGFETACQELLKLEKPTQVAIANVVLLGKPSAETAKVMLSWLDEITEARPQDTAVQLLHAAALLRSGQAKEALAKLNEIPATTDADAQRLLWMTIAQRHLGQATTAQATLQQAKQWIAMQASSLQAQSWQDEVMERALLKEAEGK